MHVLYELPIRDERRKQYWHELIALWNDSDLTHHQFSQQHQLKLKDLYRWSYRLNHLEAKAKKEKVADSAKEPSELFAPVQVDGANEPAKHAHNPAIKITHPTGLSIELHPDFDSGALLKLLESLRAVPC